MKKSLILAFAIVLLLAACTKKKEENAHSSVHTAKLYFTSSENHNISSYNIYNHDNLIMQVASSSTTTANEYSFQLDEITQHPYELDFNIEPLFMDSASANVAIDLELWVDNEMVAENAHPAVLFGKTASLTYSGE